MRVVASTVNTEFAQSRASFDALVDFLGDMASAGLTHSELEDHLQVQGRDLLRQLLQDHVDLRAVREERLGEVAEADATIHTRLERGHTRGVATIFGDIEVARLGLALAWGRLEPVTHQHPYSAGRSPRSPASPCAPRPAGRPLGPFLITSA